MKKWKIIDESNNIIEEKNTYDEAAKYILAFKALNPFNKTKFFVERNLSNNDNCMHASIHFEDITGIDN